MGFNNLLIVRVFILCTGRTGSSAFIEACKYITNYTCGHESRVSLLDDDRFDFPDNHIEADNRLSWQLGRMEEIFGDDPVYIHLIRNKEDTARSYMNRFFKRKSIISAYSEGILMTPPETLNDEDKLNISKDYYEAVNANIRLFLMNKSKTMKIQLRNVKLDFTKFWMMIGAEGNLEAALETFNRKHNASYEMKNEGLYRLKLWLLRMKKRIFNL